MVDLVVSCQEPGSLGSRNGVAGRGSLPLGQTEEELPWCIDPCDPDLELGRPTPGRGTRHQPAFQASMRLPCLESPALGV